MSGWLRGKTANIVDLFAGTGGMGLASLVSKQLAGRSRILHCAELNGAYVSSIRTNFEFFAEHIGHKDQVPRRVYATDISTRGYLHALAFLRQSEGVDLLLAGPPCQGFSKSNSMSREAINPLNLLAMDTVQAIRTAEPSIAVIENVPGIQNIASVKNRRLTVTEHIERSLQRNGYRTATMILDAADYGVPQHRLRTFTIAIHRRRWADIDCDDLAPPITHGPHAGRAHRTVGDVLSDLPRLHNGSTDVVLNYTCKPQTTAQRELRRFSRKLYDHVTTNHADYVLDRYRDIPIGGNWRSIKDQLHNYTNPENTHTNIYHRLDPSKPARTIGNFRKAMTVHPYEDRGLSLREAARLQSLPDWLRFFPDDPIVERGRLRGLGLKQQQVGNAVCFRLTTQLVDHLFANA